jgi:hypothetical protein
MPAHHSCYPGLSGIPGHNPRYTNMPAWPMLLYPGQALLWSTGTKVNHIPCIFLFSWPYLGSSPRQGVPRVSIPLLPDKFWNKNSSLSDSILGANRPIYQIRVYWSGQGIIHWKTGLNSLTKRGLSGSLLGFVARVILAQGHGMDYRWSGFSAKFRRQVLVLHEPRHGLSGARSVPG